MNIDDLADPEPPTIAYVTFEHFSLYSAVIGPGAYNSKNSLSHTKSVDSWAATLFKIVDILNEAGINTFLWFEVLAKNDAKPNGVSRSKLINTGLAAYPLVTS